VGTAIGIVPHTGWAWLVRVSGTPTAARVEARSTVVACDVAEGELYHRAADLEQDRAEFVALERATALERARSALDSHLREAGAAVVLGRQMSLPPVDRIVTAHPLIHGAEGELWRAIFAEACLARGVPVVRTLAARVREALAQRHGEPAVAAFLEGGRREVGSPFGREVQDAALGAWQLL
jgi:hypothetical protein